MKKASKIAVKSGQDLRTTNFRYSRVSQTRPNTDDYEQSGLADISIFKTEIEDLDDFQNECLKAHNEYRSLHNVEPLQLSQVLCNYAQEWADKLIELGRLQHRTDNRYGENIYYAQNVAINGAIPVNAWYSEIKYYKFGTNKLEKNTGHFTQVVWKNSKQFGVGIAQKNSDCYVVANYDPPGNYVRKYLECVLKPK